MITNWHFSSLGIDKVKELSGRYTGLLTDEIFYDQGVNTGIHMNICTASLPNYEKLVVGPEAEINYHLAGYGTNLNDSITRLGGESVERAAGIFSHFYLKKRIITASYSDLSKYAIKLEYLTPYTNKQLQRLHELDPNFLSKNPTFESKQAWIKTNSLFYPQQKIYVPENVFLFGPKSNRRTFLAVSTGTAAHVNWSKALLNSIIEYVQIDAFMYSWYSSKVYDGFYLEQIKNYNLKNTLLELLGEYKNYYRCLIINVSKYAQVPLNIYGVFLISKDHNIVPAISFGLQGGLNTEETIIRAFCEALADVKMSETNFIRNSKFANINLKNIIDFDNNVEYFANPQNYNKNMNYLLNRINFNDPIFNNSSVNNLFELIDSLKKVAPQASFLDITPPYINGYRVVRVFIPEFLAMTFPSFPQLNHPRLKKYVNDKFYIHPMP